MIRYHKKSTNKSFIFISDVLELPIEEVEPEYQLSSTFTMSCSLSSCAQSSQFSGRFQKRTFMNLYLLMMEATSTNIVRQIGYYRVYKSIFVGLHVQYFKVKVSNEIFSQWFEMKVLNFATLNHELSPETCTKLYNCKYEDFCKKSFF